LSGTTRIKLVALLLRHQRQADAGIAGGALDQGGARPDVSCALGCLDHGQADAVLDRTAGVRALEFQVQLAAAGVELLHLDHRRLADQFEHAVDLGHGRLPQCD
jgi:hypothetical protein